MNSTNEEFIANLGNKIARLRKANGLNQFEFADRCGKMVNTISKIERGVGDPRLSTLLDIAEALNISLPELVSNYYSFAANNRKDNAVETLVNSFNRCDNETQLLVINLLKHLAK